MARVEWKPEAGHVSEEAFPKRARKWGNLSFRKTPWGWVVQTTPRASSSKARAVLDAWSSWLFWMNQVFKVTHPEVLSEYYRQQRISRVQARDIWSSAGFGYLFYFEDESGRRIYSMAHRERFSRTLDVFGQDIGAILVRGHEVWEAIPPGPAGSVLVSRGPGQAPEWGSVTAGGFGGVVLVDINRPDSAEFTLFRPGRPGGGVVWRPYGAVLRSVAGSGTNPTVLLYNDPLPGMFDIVVGFISDFTNTGDQHRAGVCVYSVTTRTAVSFDFMDSLAAIRNYYNNFTLEGRVASVNYRLSQGVLTFVRLVQDSSARRFYVSSNGVDWILILSRGIEHAIENLRWGVLLDARNASSDFLMHFVHYSVS